MTQNLLTFTLLLPLVLFISVAISSWFQYGARPMLVKRLGSIATITGMVASLVLAWSVYIFGVQETALIGVSGLGLSLRVDALSILMSGMISLLGFIILKFSTNYLDGDARQGTFIGRIAATIVSVQLLVLSGNLVLLLFAWILTSISLHRLLVFYPNRPGARVAAKKKAVLARLGDLSLLAAIVLIYFQYGTGNLGSIFIQIADASLAELPFAAVEGPALLLVLTALLKSAQFPTHGWLIEVMETPTPVSALLHAGLLNAGPFLIIRMAFLMDASSVAPVLLMAVGGFTALFASVAFLTQTSIKTALGYSSIAHMGFSLMVCGLGVYPAALLHLVAHSFYKAHAFLSSGSVIDILRASRVTGVSNSLSIGKMILGTALTVVVFFGCANLWGIHPAEEISLLLVGGVIILGLLRLITSGLMKEGNVNYTLRSIVLALIVVNAFFLLESGFRYLLGTQLPELTLPAIGKLITAIIILSVFALAVFVQLIGPTWSMASKYHALAIHLRNGFYANALFDRIIGALRVAPRIEPSRKQADLLESDEREEVVIYDEQLA